MKYVMSIERFAEERGRQQGIEQGAVRERRKLILRQLNRKLGVLPDQIRSQISDLSPSQLDDLGEALLDFAELSELNNWLSQLEMLKVELLEQLAAQLGQLDEAVAVRVQALSLSPLTVLQAATADFSTIAELADWLEARSQTEANSRG